TLPLVIGIDSKLEGRPESLFHPGIKIMLALRPDRAGDLDLRLFGGPVEQSECRRADQLLRWRREVSRIADVECRALAGAPDKVGPGAELLLAREGANHVEARPEIERQRGR